MQIGFTYSILLHIALLLVFMFGVDYSKRLQQQEETILLELIPISTITNVKTTLNDVKPIDIKKEVVSKNDAKQDSKTVLQDSDSDNQNVSQKKVAEKEKEIKKPEPKPDLKEEVEEPKPIPEIKKEIEKPKDEKVVEDKEKIPTKEIKKEPEKKKEIKKEDKKPIEKKIEKKQENKKKDPEKPKKEKKKEPDDNLANSVLKSLKEGGKKSSKNNKQKQQSLNDIMENAIKGDTTSDFDNESELSMSEIAAIRSQISQAWRVTSFSGGKDNKNLQVIVKIQVDENGEVKDIKIKNKTTPSGADGKVYNAFIDSVMRAIKTASPLQHLPKEKYDTWNEMELIFDSSGMIY